MRGGGEEVIEGRGEGDQFLEGRGEESLRGWRRGAAGISGGFLSRLAWDWANGRLAQTEVARAIDLRNIVTSLGPAYIKLGQALSIRPDLLSPAAMNELQKLCDKVPSFDSAVAMEVVREELGAPWYEVRPRALEVCGTLCAVHLCALQVCALQLCALHCVRPMGE